MKNSFFYFLLFSFLITSCTGKKETRSELSGGHVRIAIQNEPRHYCPQFTDDYYTATLLAQCYEGLVSFNSKTLEIEGRIAKRWEVSNDGKTFTFYIHDEIYFHPNEIFETKEDRKLNTSDIKYSIEKSCMPSETNEIPSSYSLLYKESLIGAQEFFNGKAKEISGLSITDSTVTLQIKQPEFNFLNKLANISCAVVSEKTCKANSELDKPIGTGPFIYSKYLQEPSARIILTRNEEYYLLDSNGFSLPYLDTVSLIFEPKKMNQFTMFEQDELDLIVGVPTSKITSMMEDGMDKFKTGTGKYVLSNNYLLESSYYIFNLTDERFKDPRVRKAFNYAFNKQIIGEEILFNQYNDLGYFGIVPPISQAFQGYDFKNVSESGYSYNPELAKQLLKEAGYPNGNGFGTVTLRYNIDDVHSAIADEFAKQILQNLGITVNIDGSNFDRLAEDAALGDGDIFRMGWSADYPSPESFLANFYGASIPDDVNAKSKLNKSRYSNPTYDSLFLSARKSTTHKERMRLFSEAEVELMKNPPIIPVWYTGDLLISRSYLQNFHFNALNIYDFKNTYIRRN